MRWFWFITFLSFACSTGAAQPCVLSLAGVNEAALVRRVELQFQARGLRLGRVHTENALVTPELVVLQADSEAYHREVVAWIRSRDVLVLLSEDDLISDTPLEFALTPGGRYITGQSAFRTGASRRYYVWPVGDWLPACFTVAPEARVRIDEVKGLAEVDDGKVYDLNEPCNGFGL